MLTKSLIYPIAAVTGIVFRRWTEKLEWTRWTLAWEKRVLTLPPHPKQHTRQTGEDLGRSEQSRPMALLLQWAPRAKRAVEHLWALSRRPSRFELSMPRAEQRILKLLHLPWLRVTSPAPISPPRMWSWKGCPCRALQPTEPAGTDEGSSVPGGSQRAG